MRELFKETFERVRDSQHAEYSAALAFYVMISVIPLIVLTISAFSFIFPVQNIEQQIVSDINALLGSQLAQAITQLVESEQGFDASGALTAAWGIGTLVWAASRMFEFVYLTVNEAWNVDEEQEPDGLRGRAKKRGLAILFTLAAGLAIFILSFADTLIRRFFPDVIPGNIEVRLGLIVFSLLVFSFLFAALYKVLPDDDIAWRDALVGGGLTAALFMIGQIAISLIFENRDITASIGLAGAVIVFMTWVYYSARVFMVGAAFTHVYAQREQVRAAA